MNINTQLLRYRVRFSPISRGWVFFVCLFFCLFFLLFCFLLFLSLFFVLFCFCFVFCFFCFVFFFGKGIFFFCCCEVMFLFLFIDLFLFQVRFLLLLRSRISYQELLSFLTTCLTQTGYQGVVTSRKLVTQITFP